MISRNIADMEKKMVLFLKISGKLNIIKDIQGADDKLGQTHRMNIF